MAIYIVNLLYLEFIKNISLKTDFSATRVHLTVLKTIPKNRLLVALLQILYPILKESRSGVWKQPDELPSFTSDRIFELDPRLPINLSIISSDITIPIKIFLCVTKSPSFNKDSLP